MFLDFEFRRAYTASALACLGCLALTPAPASADGAGANTPDSFALGLAVMPTVRPYRSFNDKTEVVPIVMFENRWVRVFGPGAELKLAEVGPVRFGLTASYARDGYSASDSPALDGMATRKSSAWLGARASMRDDIANVSVEWSGDASNASKGQKLKLGVERSWQMGDWGFTPRLTATWHDRKFVQYYFGVTNAEARPDRAAYSPGATVNTEIALRVDYRIAAQQLVFADFGVKALGSEIKNSPLVDRSTQPELRVGYLYRF